MSTDLLGSISAIFSLAAFVTAVLVYVRLREVPRGGDVADRLSRLAEAGDRLERLVRDEASRGREEQGASAKTLRVEVAGAVRGFQDSVLKGMAEMQGLQKTELEVFARQLGGGVAAVDRRAEGMASTLKAGMESMAEVAQRRMEDLRGLLEGKLGELRKETTESDKALRQEVSASLKSFAEVVSGNIGRLGDVQREKLEGVTREIGILTEKHEQGQEGLRKSVEERLDALRGENSQKLEQMRQTVDEKLQGTLEKRLGESFKLVSERLEQVHKGLGEMQSLANGVGDLKRVLTNVKARGTWGEVQLGNLLEQVLTPDQYTRDAVTKPGSLERVEYAIRLPGRGEGDPEVLLPLDAKFPHEDYDRLLQAADRADAEAVEAAAKQLENRVKASAKDIRDKYINPPHTTDFAILFLPTEGLYAEVLRRPGLVEQVQRDFRVSLAGPTTLAATLNALQMGFRTLAIQRRSSEVWQVLEAVKTEFGKYGEVLDKVQKKLHDASKTIEGVSVRRRAIDRKLRSMGTLPDASAEALLGLTSSDLDDMAGDEAAEAGAEQDHAGADRRAGA